MVKAVHPMKRSAHATPLRLERLFVAWVALALTLMLPLSPWVPLSPTAHPNEVTVVLTAGSTAAVHEGALPTSETDDSQVTGIQLFEDDIIHEDHVLHAPRMSEKRALHRAVEPQAPHPERLERPPLARA